MIFSKTFEISFGHCDPAGIIFYPNYFRWFDATYQAYLTTFGLDMRDLWDRLNTIGTGLIDVGATFRAPTTFGDVLDLRMTDIDWSKKTFRITYQGYVEGRTVVEGHEIRGVFVREGERLTAAPVAPLRDLIGNT
jgi:4-hydroxybenzoyl-CoA thioesterase